MSWAHEPAGCGLQSRGLGARAARAGGLAVALADALRDRGGLVFGWSGRVSDPPVQRPPSSRRTT